MIKNNVIPKIISLINQQNNFIARTISLINQKTISVAKTINFQIIKRIHFIVKR